MLLIDVPVGLIAGQVIADAGRNMLRSGRAERTLFLEKTTVTFAYCFITPIMVQLDIPAAFAASQLFAYIGRKQIRKEADLAGEEKPAIYYRYLFYSVFFAAVVIAPAGLYLVCGWPGWEQIYWSERFETLIHTGWVNALCPTLFIAGIVLAGYGGFRLAYYWITKDKERYLLPSLIGVLAAAAGVVVACYPSFLLVGSFDQYHNIDGETREAMASVWENPFDFGYGWTGVMIYFGVSVVYMVRKLIKENREARL